MSFFLHIGHCLLVSVVSPTAACLHIEVCWESLCSTTWKQNQIKKNKTKQKNNLPLTSSLFSLCPKEVSSVQSSIRQATKSSPMVKEAMAGCLHKGTTSLRRADIQRQRHVHRPHIEKYCTANASKPRRSIETGIQEKHFKATLDVSSVSVYFWSRHTQKNNATAILQEHNRPSEVGRNHSRALCLRDNSALNSRTAVLEKITKGTSTSSVCVSCL